MLRSFPNPSREDSAPKRSLLEAVVAFNTLRAITKRSTMFVTDLLHPKEGAVISRIIQYGLNLAAERAEKTNHTMIWSKHDTEKEAHTQFLLRC